jgi:hypothetical protein
VPNSLKDAHVAARVGALLKPSHSSSSSSRSGSDSSSTYSSRSSSSSSHTSTTAHTTASGRTAPAAAVVVQAAAFVSSECSIVELKLEQCSISAAALAAMAAGLTASTSLQVTLACQLCTFRTMFNCLQYLRKHDNSKMNTNMCRNTK